MLNVTLEQNHIIQHLEFRMRRSLTAQEYGILSRAIIPKYSYDVIVEGVDMIRSNSSTTIYILVSIMKKLKQRKYNKTFVLTKMGEVSLSIGDRV